MKEDLRASWFWTEQLSIHLVESTYQGKDAKCKSRLDRKLDHGWFEEGKYTQKIQRIEMSPFLVYEDASSDSSSLNSEGIS